MLNSRIMKKLFTFLLVLVAAIGTANANYYFTLAENDTLRISPNALNWHFYVPVIAEFDNGVCDHWRLEVYYPNALSWDNPYFEYTATGPVYGMNIPYNQSDGSEAIYEPSILTLQNETAYNTTTKQVIIESSTTVYGYWDYNNDGIYEPYGKVKWGPGRYDRYFDMRFYVNSDCTGDSIVFDGQMSCTFDTRYPTHLIDTQFYRVIHLVVAFMVGDVNGDDTVNIFDVSALQDYFLGNLVGLSQYQLDAADVNGDGEVTIGDMSALVDLLLGCGTYEIGDFEDL